MFLDFFQVPPKMVDETKREKMRICQRSEERKNVHVFSLRFVDEEKKSGFSEHGFMRRIFKECFCNAIQRRHIKCHQKNIEMFEQAFTTIKNTTGISDIEEIVRDLAARSVPYDLLQK